MKIVNVDGENLHIFRTPREISMKCSWKIWLTIILKTTKNQGFTLSLQNTFLHVWKNPKARGVEMGKRNVKLSHPAFQRFFLHVRSYYIYMCIYISYYICMYINFLWWIAKICNRRKACCGNMAENVYSVAMAMFWR